MTREEEILKAVETIRKAIVDKTLYSPQGWSGRPELLKEIVIRYGGVHLVTYTQDGGRDLGNGYCATEIDISDRPVILKIQDPTIAIKAERDAAQAKLLEKQDLLERIAKEKAEAQKRLDELNNKLIGS